MTHGIRCSRCEQTLDPEAFSPSHRTSGNWCRDCRRGYQRSYSRTGQCAACGRPATGLRCMTCYRKSVKVDPPPPRPPKPRLTDAEYEASLALLPHDLRLKRLRSSKRWHDLRARVMAEESDCGICGELVDKSLSGHDRMGPTGDHITPIELGGAFFDRANVQLAHRSCNCKAGRRLQDMRLTTFTNAGAWLGEHLASGC